MKHPNREPQSGETQMTPRSFEKLADKMGLSLVHLNLSTGEMSMNANTLRMVGHTAGEMPQSKTSKMQLTVEDDRARVQEALSSILSGEQESYQVEYRMRRKDQTTLSVSEVALVSERDADGNPMTVDTMTLDLTRLRIEENKVRELERDMRNMARETSNEELSNQNRMLRACNSAANLIIGGEHQDYEMLLKMGLQILADSVFADRAAIWRNEKHENGKLGCFLRTEWTREASHELSHRAPRLEYDEFMPNWESIIQNPIVFRTGADERLSEVMHIPGVNRSYSIMAIPLFLQGEFWGFVEFDNYSVPNHVFTESEADIMTSGTLVIASSISRNETFAKLNVAREQAMASTRAKGDFLSRMSHEIRTPMNAIIGMTTIAKKSDNPERIRYCLNKVDSSSRQLLSLINDILDMSKIEANKLEITNAPFDFESMMQSVFDIIQVKLEERHQDFHFDFDQLITRYMIGDQLRLTQVLINLLNNAVKFTPVNGKISLYAREIKQDESRSTLHMEVIDTGIGIEEGNIAKLFESFEQADGSITRQYGGTGLGLAICKNIVELMGGKIWVESVYGEGSRFIFEIPVTWGESLPAPATIAFRPEQLRILVADDQEEVRDYFRNILGTFHIACDTAEDGVHALELVRKKAEHDSYYDFVFVDWIMPHMNGGETCREVRKITENESTIILMSVSDWSDIRREAGEGGFHKFMSKPVLPSALYNMIVRVTGETLIEDPSEENRQMPDWSGKTILVAEDVEINREIMESILAETQVKLVFAEDGLIALHEFHENASKYDLILMDVQMPNMDGLESTRQIRALDFAYAKSVPIIAMTANAFAEDEQLCLAAGMNAHLAKPIDVDEVIRTVGSYLNLK